jgi:NTP pyrophosphatase (non-canonical NTP hydrolase)
MEFDDLQQRAVAIRERYALLERARYGSAWTREEVLLGFAGDVGDLAKLALACEGRRTIAGAEPKLAHELADCLWSVLVLAHLYGVDLEREFFDTMNTLERHIDKNLQA